MPSTFLSKRKKMIIFDFDGTLVDIQPVFLKIFNTLAPEFGYTPLLEDDIIQLRELSLRRFIWERLGWRIIFLPQLLRRGREEYHKHIPEVKLFPGIQEVITTLQAQEFHVGIVSSSEKETVRTLIKKFNIEIDFISHSTLFGKSKTLKEIIIERGYSLENTIYIGDEVRDRDACRKIGLEIISVTWGLNNKEALRKSGQTLFADTPSELLDILLQNE